MDPCHFMPIHLKGLLVFCHGRIGPMHVLNLLRVRALHCTEVAGCSRQAGCRSPTNVRASTTTQKALCMAAGTIRPEGSCRESTK